MRRKRMCFITLSRRTGKGEARRRKTKRGKKKGFRNDEKKKHFLTGKKKWSRSSFLFSSRPPCRIVSLPRIPIPLRAVITLARRQGRIIARTCVGRFGRTVSTEHKPLWFHMGKHFFFCLFIIFIFCLDY